MAKSSAFEEEHWIWGKFDELNARYFGGVLERPQQILRSAFAAWTGAAVNKIVADASCRLIWIDGAAADEDTGAASDSLLHEMVHYELATKADGDGDQEHGIRFMRRADEIGAALDLLPCELDGLALEQMKAVASVWPKVQRQVQRNARKRG